LFASFSKSENQAEYMNYSPNVEESIINLLAVV
jgi:hypothetical protein